MLHYVDIIEIKPRFYTNFNKQFILLAIDEMVNLIYFQSACYMSWY